MDKLSALFAQFALLFEELSDEFRHRLTDTGWQKMQALKQAVEGFDLASVVPPTINDFSAADAMDEIMPMVLEAAKDLIADIPDRKLRDAARDDLMARGVAALEAFAATIQPQKAG